MVNKKVKISFLFSFLLFTFFSCKKERIQWNIPIGIYEWTETRFTYQSKVITPDSVNTNFQIHFMSDSSIVFYENFEIVDIAHVFSIKKSEGVAIVSGNNFTKDKKRIYSFSAPSYSSNEISFYCYNFPYQDVTVFQSNYRNHPDFSGYNKFVKKL